MNEDKMKLEEAKRIINDFIMHRRFNEKRKYNDEQLFKAMEYFTFEDFIPKKKIEEYLVEETEKYKVYKKEVDKNENLRGQLWHHMGAKNMCEKILGIEKTVTLD